MPEQTYVPGVRRDPSVRLGGPSVLGGKGRSPLQMYSVVRNGDGETPPVSAGGVILMHAGHYSPKRSQAVLNAVRDRGLSADPLRGTGPN